MILVCDPSTSEAEVGGLGVLGQLWLHSEILTQGKNTVLEEEGASELDF